MSKVFYDYLVIKEEVDCELNNYRLDKEEKDELIDIIDQLLHHHVLNVILNHLPKDKHPEFVSRLQTSPGDDQLMEFLKQHIGPYIEEEIKKQSRKVKQEIIAEIKKSVVRKPSR
jgi:hypothetical protein